MKLGTEQTCILYNTDYSVISAGLATLRAFGYESDFDPFT